MANRTLYASLPAEEKQIYQSPEQYRKQRLFNLKIIYLEIPSNHTEVRLGFLDICYEITCFSLTPDDKVAPNHGI